MSDEIGVTDLTQKYNFDEIRIALNLKAKKCFYHHGTKKVQYRTDGRQDSVHCSFLWQCISAILPNSHLMLSIKEVEIK